MFVGKVGFHLQLGSDHLNRMKHQTRLGSYRSPKRCGKPMGRHLVVVLVDAVHPEVQDRSDAGQSEGRFRHVGGDDHLSTVNREDFSG